MISLSSTSRVNLHLDTSQLRSNVYDVKSNNLFADQRARVKISMIIMQSNRHCAESGVFKEGGMVLSRGLCGTLKRVVWYFEEGGVVH